MTDPPQNLTVWLIHSGRNSSPFLLRTYTLPSETKRLNFDSSDQIIWCHWLKVQCFLSMAHFRRTRLWRWVSNGFFLATRPCKPSLTSVLLTVLELHCTPQLSIHSLFSWGLVSLRSFKQILSNDRSSLGVVILGLPVRFLSSTLPVFFNLDRVLETELWLCFILFAIWTVEYSSSCKTTILMRSSWVSFLDAIQASWFLNFCTSCIHLVKHVPMVNYLYYVVIVCRQGYTAWLTLYCDTCS